MTLADFQNCEFELFKYSNKAEVFASLSIYDSRLSISLDGRAVIRDLPLRSGVKLEEPWGKLCYEPSATFSAALDLLSIQFRSWQVPEDIVLIDRRSGKGKSAFGNIGLRKRELPVPALTPKGYNVLSIETALY